MLNGDFSEKDLGLVSPPHFVDDFPIKAFLMLYSVEILSNICIAVVCFPDCNIINF